MLLEIPLEIIEDIAEQLDFGMECFYNLKTGELEYYPDELRFGDFEYDGPWKEAIDKVEKAREDYIKFEGMDSHASFRVMENFVSDIPQEKIRKIFEEVLQRKKPFQQFRHTIQDHPDLQEDWFDYKFESLVDFVKEQIAGYDLSEESEEEEEEGEGGED